MPLYKDECGHPWEWNLFANFNGRKYTYCIGCIVEKLGLDNLEAYDCPFIKLNGKKTAPKVSPRITKASKE